MRSADRTAARRWARALLDVALERQKAGGADPSALAAEIGQVVVLVRDNTDVHAALTHPTIPNERRKSVGRALCQSGGASDVVGRLLEMLIERERVSWLPEIAALYDDLWNTHRGVARAEASTAIPLDAGTLDELAIALGKAAHLTVDVAGRTDPAVLGGVLVRMGGKTYDGTVRHQLRALRQTLTQGA